MKRIKAIVFSGKSLTSRLLAIVSVFFLCVPSYAQEGVSVSGTVKDASGQVVPGASVFVDGTTIGVSTDLDGNYQLKVPSSKSVLVFSCIGYVDQRLTVGSRVKIDVVLVEDNQLLDEIVVVGYGVQKKESSVASIAQVKGDDLARTNHTNIASALSGQVSGVSVIQNNGMPGDEGQTILIRGKSSWNGGQPLVLVDGVERDYRQIDPNEIETMSVLKDASATAVFGVRGANGVILVTTKRGQVGQVKVNVTAESGFKQPINMIKPMNAYQTGLAINTAAKNDGEWGSLLSDEVLEHYRTHDMPYVYTDTDWQDFMLKNGYQQKYNVNVSGGTEFARVFASLGYLHDGDIINTVKHEQYDPTYKYDRYNYRFNIDLNLTKTTLLSVDAGGYIGIRNKPYEGNNQRCFRPIFTLGPMDGVPFYPASVLDEYPDNERPDENGWRLGTTELTNAENPYVGNSFSGSRNFKTSNVNIGVTLKQDLDFITPGLNVKLAASYTGRSIWQKDISYDALSYKLLHDGTWISRFGRDGNAREESVDQPKVNTESLNSHRRQYYYEASVNYARKFGKHDVTGMVVAQRKQVQSGVSFPSYEQGVAARATYAFDNRYLFEGNLGYNGSEQFSPDNQYGFFPSFAVGYNLHNEKFFKPLKRWVNKAKMRASWGEVGSDAASARWLFISEYGTGSADCWTPGLPNTPGVSLKPIVESKAANLNATWEIAIKRDLGFEFSFLKNDMIVLNMDFYNETRTGILLARQSIPNYVGITSKDMNLGKTKTKGYEIDVKWQYTTPSGDWYFFVKPTISFSDNRIVNKDEPLYSPAYKKVEGYRIGQVKGYHHTGYISDADALMTSPAYGGNPIGLGYTEYVDFTGDGQIDENDMFAFGYSQTYPLTNYALSLGFSYKNFDFDLLFQAATDLSRFACDNFAWPLHRLSKQIFDYQQDFWTPDNKDARYPAIHTESYRQHNNIKDGSIKTTTTYDASYIRLKNVNLNYNFPKKWLKKVSVSSASVYLRGNNIFTLCPNYPLGDPEASDGGENITNGFYPMTRTFTLGLRIGF